MSQLMALDLKPLTKEVIQKMGWVPHDLWLVKLDEEIYGPFEVESLKHYATENEALFDKALASRMDVSDWHPFFSHAHFNSIEHHSPEEKKAEEKYWVLIQGHKAGPLSFMDINKKLELEIVSLADLVSTDDGETWKKFYQLEAFNQHQDGPVELPMAPLDSCFQRAREEVDEWMDTHERTDSKINLAAMAFLGQIKNKPTLNLDEIDLKSLEQTEVSRSLIWAAPAAVGILVCFVALGNFLLSPSGNSELADVSEKPEVIMPKTLTHTAGRPRAQNHYIPDRSPSSYQPMPSYERSGLTAPITHSEPYRREDPQYNEPDPMNDPISEAEPNPSADPQEHSLLGNQLPHEQATPPGESLDQAMNGGDQPLEAPVIEEATDF